MRKTTAPHDGLGSHHFGFEGRLHLPSLQQLPVDALEEGMQTDVAHNSQSACWLSLKQLPGNESFIKDTRRRRTRKKASICCSPDPFQQVLGLLVDPARIMGRVHADGLKQLVLIVSVERWLTDQHLIQQDSKGPPVHGEGILLTQQDLSPKTSMTSETHQHNPAAQMDIWKQVSTSTVTVLPREQYSPGFHRTSWRGSPQTRSPCTCQSQRSLYDPRDLAWRCLTSNPCTHNKWDNHQSRTEGEEEECIMFKLQTGQNGRLSGWIRATGLVFVILKMFLLLQNWRLL